MNVDFDRSKSLRDLVSEAPEHPLCLKPLAEFTPRDVLNAIRERLGLAFVVPIVLEKLEQSPMLRADRDAGDLLEATVAIEPTVWRARLDLFDRLFGVLRRRREATILAVDEADRDTVFRIEDTFAGLLSEGFPSASTSPVGPTKATKLAIQHLPKDEKVWQLNAWDIGDDELSLWLTFVTCPYWNLIVTYRVTEEKPTPKALWDTLVQAILYPCRGEPRQPNSLRLPLGQEWQTLLPHLMQLGVQVWAEKPDDFELVDGLVELMSDLRRGKHGLEA